VYVAHVKFGAAQAPKQLSVVTGMAALVNGAIPEVGIIKELHGWFSD